MHVPVAFDPTLSRRPTSQAFFVLTACLLLLGAGGRVAAAQNVPASEPTWAVELLPASRCADDAVLRDRLSAQIPEAQRSPLGQAELRARVMIGRDQVATVQVIDQLTQREAGQRQIAVPRGGCDAAADALELVMAVMIEAGRSLLPPPVSPSPEPSEPPPPAPEPRAKQPTKQEEQAARPRYVQPERHAWLGPVPGHDLLIAAGTGYGILPSWGVAGTAAWGIRWARVWPLWISGTGWLSERANDARGQFGAAYGTVSVCPLVLEKTRFRGELCPGLAIGAMWAEGRRVERAERAVSPLAMASLGVNARVKLIGPLELVALVRGEVPVMGLTFVYYSEDGGSPRIHDTKPVTVSFFGGVGLRFR